MSLTLRQLQRMISISSRNVKETYGTAHSQELASFCAAFSDSIGYFGGGCGPTTYAHAGTLVSVCPCGCQHKETASRLLLRSLIDSLARIHGASTPLADVIKQRHEEIAEKLRQQNQRKNQRNDNSGKNGHQPAGRSGSGERADSDWEEKAEIARAAADKRKQWEANAAADNKRHRARARAEEADAKAAIARLRQQSKASPTAMRYEQQRLKGARRQASFQPRTPGSPSLKSRKALGGQTARMRAVPPVLRARMARLIERLVGQGGSVGGQLGPTPILSTRKLVKRMLSRRPLANALKEDVVVGRPVTLFLPDVSQSCEETSQDACDLANAAGYSGVPGSDVLVFPHSNGLVAEGDSSICDGTSYTPWFNGKPVVMLREEQEVLFAALIAGKSKYRVRVVVALGDHDAEYLYEQMAALQAITRLVWLHNFDYDASGGKAGKRLRINTHGLTPSWTPSSMQKLTLVSGCTTCGSMLAGFDMATR